MGGMSEMCKWFVFFTHTGKEHAVCNYLNGMFDDERTVAFVPQVELVYKNSGQTYKKLKPMFPGYVLAESVMDSTKFARKALQIVKQTTHFINLLGKENPEFMSLHEKEKEFLLNFCVNRHPHTHVVEKSIGFIEGDKLIVTSGPLCGRESIVKRIDRHKKRAEIELEFMGNLRRVNVSLEVVSKI